MSLVTRMASVREYKGLHIRFTMGLTLGEKLGHASGGAYSDGHSSLGEIFDLILELEVLGEELGVSGYDSGWNGLPLTLPTSPCPL